MIRLIVRIIFILSELLGELMMLLSEWCSATIEFLFGRISDEIKTRLHR